MTRTPQVTCLNLHCPARFAQAGWKVRVYGDNQTYHLQKTAAIILPNGGISEGEEYRASLEERQGGWIGIGWNGRALYIRTIGPNEHVHVELSLEAAAELVERMRASQGN